MRQDQYELKGAVLEAPLEWQGLRLVPGRGGVLVTGLEGTDQRRFQRQLRRFLLWRQRGEYEQRLHLQ